MASGDENESLGYAGYMWEPEYSEEELFERLSDTDDGGDIGHARSADLTWCTCSFCASMPSLKESTCCQEFEHLLSKLQENGHISYSVHFMGLYKCNTLPVSLF